MKRYNIVLSVSARDEAFDRMARELSRCGSVSVCGLDDYELRGADIFIGKKLDEKKLATADRLEAVFAYKTGVDDFPVGALANMGVRLFNSHVNSEYIAEYAFSLGAALTARVCAFDRAMRNGDWRINDPWWRSIFDMRAGLLGYGGIGRAIHKILTANGIKAVTLDRGKRYEDIETVRSLDELCARSDILFVSLPKTAETDRMIDSRVLGRLRGKYIVNVGRHNCIDERALFDALESGSLAGAAMDTGREKQLDPSVPLKPFDAPFDTLDNVILSSHKAMQVADGHARYVADTTANVLAYIDGHPRNEVRLDAGY